MDAVEHNINRTELARRIVDGLNRDWLRRLSLYLSIFADFSWYFVPFVNFIPSLAIITDLLAKRVVKTVAPAPIAAAPREEVPKVEAVIEIKTSEPEPVNEPPKEEEAAKEEEGVKEEDGDGDIKSSEDDADEHHEPEDAESTQANNDDEIPAE